MTIPTSLSAKLQSASARCLARTAMVTACVLSQLFLVAIPSQLNAAGPAPVDLGTTKDFVILSGAAITTTGGGIINGDVGASPISGSAIGVTCAQVNGTVYAVDASGPPCAVIDATFLTVVKGDLTIAYNDAAGRTPTPTGPNLNPGLIPGSGNIGGMVLAPGLYKFTTTAMISGSDVTLTGAADDVWIFQCAQDLQLASGRKVILAGGAQAKNVFWQVGTSAVLGTSSVFKGTILADQAITMQTSSTMEGRALAFSAGVTFNGSGATVSKAPEIAVEQPLGVDILDGGIKDFGPVLPGDTKDLIFTVTNSGDGDLDLTLPITLTGLDAGLFNVTVPPSSPVLPGGTTTFTVRFAPLTTGIKVAALGFANNDSDENPFDINLTGTGALAPEPEIEMEQPVGVNIADNGNKDFGAVLVGGNKDLVYTVTNSGNANLNLTLPISFTGLDAALFTVTVPPTTPVLPGGTTTFTVRFAPLAAGAKAATLQLTNNDSNEDPFDINLTGSGTPVPVPEIAVEQPVGLDISDSDTKDFGPVLVGGNKDLVFTVTNSGDANLDLTLPITITGLDATLFTVTAPPTSPVLPGGTTTFTVRFAPLVAGAKVAALQLTNNDSNEDPFDISLTGSGALVPVPEIAVEQPVSVNVADGGSKDFGAVLVGNNKNLVFTVTNSGNANLDLNLPITFTGLDAALFTVTVPPTTPVLPGGTTTFTVRFAPLTTGAKVAALQLTNNDGNESPYDINLTGSGTPVPVPEIAVEQPVSTNIADGGSKDFGAVLVGSNKDLVFTVTNSGGANLNLTLPITFTGLDNALYTVTVPPTSPVLPGGTTTFTVRFAPLTVGAKIAALQLTNDDSNENPFDINLTGSGTPVPVPEIAVEQPVGLNIADSDSKDFGSVLVGSNKDLVFTVTNSGDANLDLTLPITFTGLDSALFTVTVPPTSPVLPAGTTSFTVRFAPLTAGAKIAALQLTNNDGNETPFDINLTGSGSLVPTPEIEVELPLGVNVADGGARDFGAVLTGGNKDLVFTVTNSGNANLDLTVPITFTGLDAGLFTVTAPPTSPVLPGGTTTFTVRFAPLTTGAKVAALQLTNNDANESPYDINLTGSGTPVPVPEIAVEQPVSTNIADGGSNDFGAVLVGGNKDLVFTVTNSGNANLSLTLPITLTGLDNALFTVTTPPTSPVLPGGTTTFTVRFAPLTTGAKVAALQLTNNDSNESPYDINLTGSGTPVPVPEIVMELPVGVDVADGGVQDFGGVFVNDTSDLVFTVTNSGDANLSLTLPITFTGLDNALYTVTVPPTSPVLPGGTTTFTVRFAPLTAGAKVAALQLINNDGNESPYDINLTGNGMPIGFAISTSPIILNPQTGLFEQTVSVTNNGPVALGALRFFVQALPADVEVYNASGSVAGTPFLKYNFPVAIGDTVTFMVEYYRPSRLPIPLPTFVAEATTVTPPVATGTGSAVDIKKYPNGRMLIEFATVPGRTYAVQYSSDMSLWENAGPSITAVANRTQWYDDGPPKTESKPDSVSSRFYRVVLLP